MVAHGLLGPRAPNPLIAKKARSTVKAAVLAAAAEHFQNEHEHAATNAQMEEEGEVEP